MRPITRIWAAGVSLLLLAGCGESDRPVGCGTPIPGGLIQGRVVRGQVPASVRLTATRLPSRDGGDISIDSDTSGSYRLAVSPGEYLLRVEVNRVSVWTASFWYRRDGPPYPPRMRDTLRVVANTAIRADFSLGSAIVTMQFPDSLERDVVEADLVPTSCSPADVGCPSKLTAREVVIVGTAKFRFPAVDPGDYQVRLRPRDLGGTDQSLWLPSTRDRSRATVLNIHGGATWSTSADFAGEPATLRGSVTGSWQHLASSPPTVSLFALDSTLVFSNISVKWDGVFAAKIYQPQPVKARVQFQDSSRWFGGATFAEAAVIDLQPGQEAPHLEMVESGLMLDLLGLAPQSTWNALVRLVDPHSFALIREVNFYSSSGGLYLGLTNLEPGPYLLHILPAPYPEANWLAQWYDGVSDSTQATPVLVPDGGRLARVTVQLRAAGLGRTPPTQP